MVGVEEAAALIRPPLPPWYLDRLKVGTELGFPSN